ncbi:MAG: DEAD/DEAH box helicase [Methanobrevibacter sp.]|jgi:DEAD/DEAH box helicase domain-containing protein|nr:DEAD/DEAH box helicase [Candidatus Methanovirga australis]
MDFNINKFKEDIRFRKKIVHIETIPEKIAEYCKLDDLNPIIEKYLNNENIKLYKHQATAYNKIKNKKNIIITTSTASGKTLAFNLPILDSLSSDKKGTALYIYPAKALTNDQLNVLKNLEEDLNLDIKPQRYDGDTPKSSKYSIRQNSRIILTNPYKLHHILSWHHQWKKFYSSLEYVVIDEAHYYKGIFGSNVAYLIRRLKRIAKFYGSSPQFILSSATLANPLELAYKLTGEEFDLVDEDSSPSGEKDFILYNPFIKQNISKKDSLKNKSSQKIINSSTENKISFLGNQKSQITYNSNSNDINNGNGVSIHQETELIFIYLILKDIQTLCFTVSRKIAELIARWAKQDMLNYRRRLVSSIITYRAGYLVDERREIENGLKSRKYVGVTCTNALELGIDIGSIDAVIISGYPGTMISVWQQAGRAGRENQKSLVILVAFENQLDQYFMNNPEFFFDKACENAIIDLNNQILNKSHLICASNELSLEEDELAEFNLNPSEFNSLIKEGTLIRAYNGLYSYGFNDDPSFRHSLNQLSSKIFKVINEGKLLETMELSQVYREAHEGAVLINKGETYIVDEVDLEDSIINVSKRNVEYHTVALKDVKIKIIEKIREVKLNGFTIYFGQLEVLEDFVKYKKVHFSKILGIFPLDLPPLKFRTNGLWFTVDKDLKKELEEKYDENDVFAGGLHGLEHSLIGLYPLHVMCDRFDIGGLSTNHHEDTQKPTIFIYDAYEGGIGINDKAIEVFKDLIVSTSKLLENCNCDDGCPACIYSPKCGNDNKPLHKEGTIFLLNYIKKEIGS